MPELPEVETVRRGLEPYLKGRSFAQMEVLHPRANRGQEASLKQLLERRTIRGVARRGKFLWLEFADENLKDPSRDVMFIHLGMSGQLRIGPSDSKHVRIRTRLSDGTELSFIDQRTFGYWLFAPWLKIAHIAPDPLEADFDAAAAARKIRAKRTVIKTALLDQTVVSGIGNIYADEALWRAKIHPQTKACDLSQAKALALVDAATTVMRGALAVGGTSFDALYVNVNGESGYFSRSLHAYGRTGKSCDRCGSPIRRIVVGGRSSHFCPRCQRRTSARSRVRE
ncbi:MAG: bifunctional DNA-formamidopyrimidine glycosylase/DNA-(apurinic or apyrimidinic site) lyase [Corynebacterium flavescens]|uniref:bifunctional DNA-formamidopyrimidine glycosylase/DNA-(apurinic or apyrimidinic site) lyase n=1 Tax=Corynebacterium flavescens TaxID=28028 RepID=UPI003F908597